MKWTGNDWAVYVGKNTKLVADYIRSKGYPVVGVSNGKPEIDSGFTPFPSDELLQGLAIEALSGTAYDAPTLKITKRKRK